MKVVSTAELQDHLDRQANLALARLQRRRADVKLVSLIDQAIEREDFDSARGAVGLASSDKASLDLGAHFDAALFRWSIRFGVLFLAESVGTVSFYATDAARLAMLSAWDGVIDFSARQAVEKQGFSRARGVSRFAHDNQLFKELQDVLDLAVGDEAIGLIGKNLEREAFEMTAYASGYEGQLKIAKRINSLLVDLAREQISLGSRASALSIIRQMTPWADQVRELRNHKFKSSDARVKNRLPVLSDPLERFDFSQRFGGVSPARLGKFHKAEPSGGAVLDFP